MAEYFLTYEHYLARVQCTASEHAAFHRAAPVTTGGNRRASQPADRAEIAARRRRLRATSKPAKRKTASHGPLRGVHGARHRLRFLQSTRASPHDIMAARRELLRELSK